MKKGWRITIGILLILGIAIFGGIQLERHFVAQRVTDILPIKDGTLATGAKLKNVELAPMTPDDVALQLNNEAFNLKQSSRGLISDTNAVAKNDSVTLTVTSDKLSPAMINRALTTNGDQVDQLAQKVLRSMTEAGTKNPRLTIKVVDSNNKTLKTLTYPN
ncbi:hypothetical protein ACDP95_01775 [Weissella confusa]